MTSWPVSQRGEGSTNNQLRLLISQLQAAQARTAASRLTVKHLVLRGAGTLLGTRQQSPHTETTLHVQSRQNPGLHRPGRRHSQGVSAVHHDAVVSLAGLALPFADVAGLADSVSDSLYTTSEQMNALVQQQLQGSSPVR